MIRSKLSKILLPIFLLIHVQFAFGQIITFNEVMFDALGTDYYDEFIEIVNYSNSTISLHGAYLLINGNVDTLDFPNSDTLAPNSYALILDRGYLIGTNSHTYDELIPDSTLLLTIQDNSFGLSNSEPNTLFLISESGDTLSSVITTPDQDAGYSDEKILIGGPNDPGNWGNSTTLLGTPGFKNSIFPKDYNLAITKFEIITSQELIEAGKPVEFTLTVKNIGLLHCLEAEILFGQDINCDSILQSGEILFSTIESVNSGDSLVLYPSISDPHSGPTLLIATVNFDEDGSLENNVSFLELNVPFAKNCLAINEFMYYPNPEFGGEWVELFNTSSDTLNLKDWTISDKSNEAVLTQNNFFLPPASYAIIADDSSLLEYWSINNFFIDCLSQLPTLNNTSDSIIIHDLCERTIDAIGYSKTWGYSQDTSLERKNPFTNSSDPKNWGLSTSDNGGTPGQSNSILLEEYDLKWCQDSLYIFPDHLLPGDTANLRIVFQNNGLNNACDFSIEIRHHENIDSIEQSPIILQKFYYDTLKSFQLLYDTLKWKINSAGMAYLHYNINFLPDNNLQNNKVLLPIHIGYPDKSIVINEIMYLPDAGDPEWFEIFNRNNQIVNLKNWYLKDSNSTLHSITNSTVYLKPDSFAIIAANENFLLKYPNFDGQLILPESFPTLNNISDSLVIIDGVEHHIDALQYSSIWGSATGISIERINPDGLTNSQSNWGLSQENDGATPGYENSIAVKNYDIAIDSIFISYSNVKLIEGDSLYIHLVIRNAGLFEINSFQIQIIIQKPGDAPLLESFLDTTITVSALIYPGESLTQNYKVDSIPGGIHIVVGNIILDLDENNSNDNNSCKLYIGYPENSVIINEIMYSPESGESEWFEIFNLSNSQVDLNGWQFRDANGKSNLLADTTTYLLHNSFVVIAVNKDFLQYYPDFDGTLIIPSNFPTLNNTSDSLFLIDAIDYNIEMIYYKKDWGGGDGISLERRNPYAFALDENNWGGSISEVGATPGLPNSILKYDFDLLIIPTSFLFVDSIAEVDQSVSFKLSVKNNGILRSNPFFVEIFNDRNKDSTVSHTELVWSSYNIPSLLPDSVITLSGDIYSENSGKANYIALITMSLEENPNDNISYANLLVTFAYNSLVLNEFLPYPNIEQTEFIECVNISDNVIDIAGWNLSNNRSSTTLNCHTQIPSSGYLVLAKDSSFFNYFPPSNATIIIPQKWLSLNNTSDKIIIKDLTGRTIDSLLYDDTWDLKSGISFEKIFPYLTSNNESSWSLSTSENGATPGVLNSVTPLAHDLSLDSLATSSDVGDSSSTFSITFFITNCGQTNCYNACIKLFKSSEQQLKMFESIEIEELSPGENDTLSCLIGPFQSGTHNLIAAIDWEYDEYSENDTLNFSITISFIGETILISEFMPDPFDINTLDNSISEYIEIYNTGVDSICINEWHISDNNTAKPVEIFHQNLLPPHKYFIVASDSSIFNFPCVNYLNTVVLHNFPSLNNSEDAIFITDPTGKVIDSLQYNATWKITKGISLERIYFNNPNFYSNWRASVSSFGGTPGSENSVAITTPLKKPGIKAEPNPFSPDGDGIDDEVAFQYQLPFPTAKVTLEIYDLAGRLIYRPAHNLPTSSEGAIYWNGESKYGKRARIGMYIVRFSATDIGTSKSVAYITTVVLARR